MSFPIFPVAIATAIVDTAVGGAVLWRGQRHAEGRIDTACALRSAGAIVGVFALQATVLSWWGLNMFGLIHLAYLALVVAVPLCGSAVLAVRGRATRGARGLAMAALGGLPVGVYATFLAPFDLRVEHTNIPVAPERGGREPIRVGVLADVQTPAVGPFEREAVEKLMALEPDLVLLPGDFYQALSGSGVSFEKQAPGFREIFRRVATAPHGAYLVLGNVDHPERVESMTRGTGMHVLINDVARVAVRGREISILGLELEIGRPAAQAALRAFGRDPRVDDLRIVVSHYPDTALLLEADARVDLIVAGHTHGGQIVVPGFGPPITLSDVPRDSAAGGLSRIHDRWLYVSRGLGLERGQAPRMRLFCPPEISLLSLGG